MRTVNNDGIHMEAHMRQEFRKSSFSIKGNAWLCVEVAKTQDGVVVRHSMNHEPVIHYSNAEWDAFIKGVKAGEFDLD